MKNTFYLCVTKSVRTMSNKKKSFIPLHMRTEKSIPLTDKQKQKLAITGSGNNNFLNADGSFNHEQHNDWLEQRELAKWSSVSF